MTGDKAHLERNDGSLVGVEEHSYNEAKRVFGLSPMIRQDSVVLILGTMPGTVSLRKQMYYADPSNKFWDILFEACGEKFDKTDKAKEMLLERYRIAIWDILKSAIRETANDKDIKCGKPNNLPQYLNEYTNIRLLLFHSNDTYKYFRKFYKNTTIPYIRISSPSGNNRITIREKVSEWKAALSSVIPLQTEYRLELKDPLSLK